MKKKGCFIYLMLFVYIISTKSTFSQLVIDAGNDTILCIHNDSIILGGNPTASGGIEPYKYEWTVYSALSGHTYQPYFFLSDSSIANPVMSNKDHWLNDILLVRLTVMDSIGIMETDSIRVGISSISTRTLKDCMYTINSGDSVKVEVCNHFWGMPPFKYHWTPEDIFSDPNLSNPYAKPDTTTIIQVELVDSIGCANSEDYIIIVKSVGIEPTVEYYNSSLVAPNPISDHSRVILSDQPKNSLSIQVFNLKGRLIVFDSFSDIYYKVGGLITESGVYYYIISEKSKIVSIGQFIKN